MQNKYWTIVWEETRSYDIKYCCKHRSIRYNLIVQPEGCVYRPDPQCPECGNIGMMRHSAFYTDLICACDQQ